MGIYKKIQHWILLNFGWMPKTCWIAHCKELAGIELRRKAWNRQGDERINPCPPEKRKAIFAAFKHFGMMR